MLFLWLSLMDRKDNKRDYKRDNKGGRQKIDKDILG